MYVGRRQQHFRTDVHYVDGLEEHWIGHDDVGRCIAYPGRDDGGSVHRSLIGAFIGENGFGHNASERAVGLWLH